MWRTNWTGEAWKGTDLLKGYCSSWSKDKSGTDLGGGHGICRVEDSSRVEITELEDGLDKALKEWEESRMTSRYLSLV